MWPLGNPICLWRWYKVLSSWFLPSCIHFIIGYWRCTLNNAQPGSKRSLPFYGLGWNKMRQPLVWGLPGNMTLDGLEIFSTACHLGLVVCYPGDNASWAQTDLWTSPDWRKSSEVIYSVASSLSMIAFIVVYRLAFRSKFRDCGILCHLLLSISREQK